MRKCEVGFYAGIGTAIVGGVYFAELVVVGIVVAAISAVVADRTSKVGE